jgi:transcription initiation factor TFIIB
MNNNQENDLWNLYNSIKTSFDTNIDRELNIQEDKICVNCKISKDFKLEDGYYWCNDCGENNGINIIETAEWRYYGSEDSKMNDPTRCGGSSSNLLYNMSCGTMISSKGNSPEVKRLRTIHKFITSNYNDRAILKIFDDLTIIASNHNINGIIIEHAKKIYKDIRDIKISRGINRDALVATCLMTSLNINNVSRSQKEISNIFNINQSHITQSRKKLSELNNYIKNNIIYKINITKSEHFIPRNCSILNIEKKYSDLMILICKKTSKLNDISENTPPSVACGIIYYISYLCKLNISKKDISLLCNISEVTINKVFKKLMNYTELLISSTIKENYNIKIKLKIKN